MYTLDAPKRIRLLIIKRTTYGVPADNRLEAQVEAKRSLREMEESGVLEWDIEIEADEQPLNLGPGDLF